MFEAKTGSPIGVHITMTLMYCATCGVPFGMPSELDARRREDGKDMYCPSGHQQSYKGELTRIKHQLTEMTRRAEEAEKQVRTLSTPKFTVVAPAPQVPPKTPADNKGTARERVLAYIKNAAPATVSLSMLRKQLGLAQGSVSSACSSLTRDKLLVRVGDGLYGITNGGVAATL